MSTLSVTNIKHGSSASNNIVLDSNGNATFAGTAAMGSSFLRNRIINGDMRIDQRNNGASVIMLSGVVYTVDRWFSLEDTDGAMTAQQDSSAPSGFSKSLKCTTTTADASLGATQRVIICQRIEGFNIADLGWGTASAKTITLSFWVRSSLTGTFGGSLSNVAARSYPFTYTISAADTWENKVITIPGDTSGTWDSTSSIGIQVCFGLGVGSTYSGTASAWAASDLNSATGAVSVIGTLNATWFVTGVQFEVGTTATQFERRQYGHDFALCQRYFQKYTQPPLRGVMESSTGAARCGMVLPVVMRAAPTATAGLFSVFDGNGIGTVSSTSASYLNSHAVEFNFVTSNFSTATRPAVIYQNGTESLTLSAEL